MQGREEKKSVDILSSLFEDTCNTCVPSNLSLTVDARPHSTNVFFFPASRRWSLLCACVHDSKLMVIVENEHLMALNVYHALSHSQFGEQQMPVFSSSALFSLEISSCCAPLNRKTLTYTGNTALLSYRPVLSCLCCHTVRKGATDALDLPIPITDIFFRQLFGLELSLAQSTVALVGGQSGNILFVDVRGYCHPCPSSDVYSSSNILCSLEQPIIAIHTLCLLMHCETQHMDHPSPIPSPTAANALVFIGSMGKVVVCGQARDDKGAPQFTEFHVPGPILSSSVQDRCIAYSTTRGVYRICLEPECILNSMESEPSVCTSTPIVPGSQFRFPMQVSSSYPSYIVSVCPSGKGMLRITAVSVGGKVYSFHIKPCKETKDVSEELEVGKKMKQCMNAIQNTSEQASIAQNKLKKVNSTLAELNEAFSILQLLSQSSDPHCKQFSCTIHPVSERVGVHYFTGHVEVELLYSGRGTLKRGWTLIVNTQCTSTAHGKFTTFSLTGLESNGSVRHRVKLEPVSRMPFTFSVTACICFSATHIHSTFNQHQVNDALFLQRLTNSTGVSVVVATCVVDALDFIQLCQEPSLQLLQQAPVSDVQQGKTLEMSLPLLVDNIPSGILSSDRNYTDILKELLPHNIRESCLTINHQIKVCYYDGSIVTFEVADEEGKLKLNIATSTASCMVEIASCILRRIHGGDKDSKSSTEFCAAVLTSLKVCKYEETFELVIQLMSRH